MWHKREFFPALHVMQSMRKLFRFQSSQGFLLGVGCLKSARLPEPHLIEHHAHEG